MKIFKDILNKNFKFFAAFIFGSYIFSYYKNIVYAKKVEEVKTEAKKAVDVKSNSDKNSKNDKEKRMGSRKTKPKFEVKSKAEANIKNREKNSKNKVDDEKEIDIEVAPKTQRYIDELNSGNLGTCFVFDEEKVENKKEKVDREPDLPYILKTNFESTNIENVEGIVLWQTILSEICEDEDWNNKDKAAAKCLEKALKFEKEDYSEFDDLNDYLKDKLTKKTWEFKFISRNKKDIAEDNNNNKEIDAPNLYTKSSIAEEFNIKARKYCEKLSKKLKESPKKTVEEVISKAKKSINDFIKRQSIKLDKEKNDKNEIIKLINEDIEKYENRIKYLKKRLKVLKGYKKDNDFSEFKSFLKDCLKEAQNEREKTKKNIKRAVKVRNKIINFHEPKYKDLEGKISHVLGVSYNIKIDDAYIKCLSNIIEKKEKLKEYLNFCIEEGTKGLSSFKLLLNTSKCELEILKNPNKKNRNFLNKISKKRINIANQNIKLLKKTLEYRKKEARKRRKEIKDLKSWLQKIDSVDRNELKKLIKKLTPVKLKFYYGKIKPEKALEILF